ncbi:MAG: FAD-dependent oxidoreductase [Oceanospirillaceae bacterium]|nr:FAD-dependent oxidoreductase [Oceanospirillaceae bacterium]
MNAITSGQAPGLEVDVLVVGSGAGAQAAALRAHDNGLKVLVIEKSDRYGGTSAVSGGGIWIPDNHQIPGLGGSDSFDEALQYIKTVTRGMVPEARIRAYLEHAPRMLRYLEENTRVRFAAQPQYSDYYPEQAGAKPGYRSMDPSPFDARMLGDEFARMREPSPGTLMMGRMTMTMAEARVLLCRGPGWIGLTLKILARYYRDIPGRLKSRRDRHLTLGNALVGALRRSLMDRNIPLWLGTAAQSLLFERGRVAGVRATRNGDTVEIRARKGVILGAGGFERNQQMRERYLPQPSRSEWTAAPPCNTGDGIRAALELGAATALMDHAWWAPTVRVEGEEKQRALFVERNLPGCILVNRAGQRFVNEAAPYSDIVYAMYEANRPEAQSVPAYLIFDADFRHKYPCGPLLPGYAQPDRAVPEMVRPSFKRADTLEELAQILGIDPAGLCGTVKCFNDYARAGLDPDFHKGESLFDLYYGDPTVTPNPCLAPLEKGPFYAMVVDAGDIGTKGGLVTDTRARVLNESGEPIPGLYAIGNSAASMMGPTYPGAGSTIGPAMTFGVLAADDLAVDAGQPVGHAVPA